MRLSRTAYSAARRPFKEAAKVAFRPINGPQMEADPRTPRG